MGQSINIISDPRGIARGEIPKDMPRCGNQCMRTFANFNPNAVSSCGEPGSTPNLQPALISCWVLHSQSLLDLLL